MIEERNCQEEFNLFLYIFPLDFLQDALVFGSADNSEIAFFMTGDGRSPWCLVDEGQLAEAFSGAEAYHFFIPIQFVHVEEFFKSFFVALAQTQATDNIVEVKMQST